MTPGDEKVCREVRAALGIASIAFDEGPVQFQTQFKCSKGSQRATVNVSSKGKITVQGASSELKAWLDSMKDAIEKGEAIPGRLPADFEALPNDLRTRVPDCDDVILWFFDECLQCLRGGSPAAAAFLLGAASEKSILLLIDSYASAIPDEGSRRLFQQRVGKNKAISGKYDEFRQSFRSGLIQPSELELTHDLDTYLGGAFQFYRLTRNDIGHPHKIPETSRTLVISQLGQFIIYLDRVYKLKRFFDARQVNEP